MSPVAEYALQTGLTLLGVLALAWLVLYGSRRLGPQNSKGPMQLVGRLPLDGRRAVCLVRIGEKVLVLGSSEAGISRLGELAAGEIPTGELKGQSPFAAVLGRVRLNPHTAPSQNESEVAVIRSDRGPS